MSQYHLFHFPQSADFHPFKNKKIKMMASIQSTFHYSAIILEKCNAKQNYHWLSKCDSLSTILTRDMTDKVFLMQSFKKALTVFYSVCKF